MAGRTTGEEWFDQEADVFTPWPGEWKDEGPTVGEFLRNYASLVRKDEGFREPVEIKEGGK